VPLNKTLEERERQKDNDRPQKCNISVLMEMHGPILGGEALEVDAEIKH